MKHFKRATQQRFEIFLHLTRCYGFHGISEQAARKTLFDMGAEHLGLDPLYTEAKEHVDDMDECLSTRGEFDAV